MTQQRRSSCADFKARAALAALREPKTINDLASEFGRHPHRIRAWKRHRLDELPQGFSSRKATEPTTLAHARERMVQQIGQPQYAVARLKKKAGLDRGAAAGCHRVC